MQNITKNEKNKVSEWPFADVKQKTWQQLEAYFLELQQEDISSAIQLKNWLKKKSNLSSQLSEDFAWRYIRMTCSTADETLKKNYQDFIENIEPQLREWEDKLNKKILSSPTLEEIKEEEYVLLFDRIKKERDLFRKENLALMAKESSVAMEFAALNGAMTVQENGEELTMQQAALLLKSTDREKRQRVFTTMWERRAKDETALDDVLSRLVDLRHQIAQNAGFANYRDYRFQELYRVDYGVEECFQFHDAVEKEVMPLVDKIHRRRAKHMGLADVKSQLKPWDLAVDPDGKESAKFFQNGEELAQKSIQVLNKLDPFFAECISTMKERGFLDLESRKNKAPGGYNYPLAETGIPFIFMNAVGSSGDVSTMLHESGHAIHSFLTQDLELVDFRHTPSEVAELASMSMELFSMQHWNIFLEEHSDKKNAKAEHKKAMREQLEGVILLLPWVATVDAFQHWLYENPKHSAAQRKQKWQEIYKRFLSKEIDYQDDSSQTALALRWQAQMHIFEVPFYYMEYAISQLGAVANWINFRKDKDSALKNYKAALALGYTRSIPKVYETSGIEFNFSAEYIGKLARYVSDYLEEL